MSVEGWDRDRCGGMKQGWIWRGEPGMGVEERDMDGCGGVKKGWIWRVYR